MGVIKKIILVVLVLLAVRISAQNTYDTIFFSGNRFVEHYAQAGESLKKIAKLHKVKTSDIKKANELNKRLYYNQLLYIPIFSNDIKKESFSSHNFTQDVKVKDTSVTNIALLMPYYLIKNDTMFNSYKNTLEIPDIYYNRSEIALSLHVGVDLAIDSLRKKGKKIVLHSFDTNQDTLEVKKIVYSRKLEEMDIIIGPIYSKCFQILCKRYGRSKSKILISPLSRSNDKIKAYPAVYQLAPSYKMQAEILTKYMLREKLNERIIILHSKSEKGLAHYIEHLLNKDNKMIEVFEVSNTEVDSIRKFFVEQQNVMLISSRKAFVSKLLASIGSIDSSSTVFAFESIKSYDNLDITNLMELDVHIPNSRSIDYTNTFDLSFLELFEKEYGTNTRKYTKVGYDIIMHFCNGSEMQRFNKLESGFNENNYAPIYHYVDYELIPVD